MKSYFIEQKNPQNPLVVQFAIYQNMFLFRIFGDLENYTFSETTGHTEFEK